MNDLLKPKIMEEIRSFANGNPIIFSEKTVDLFLNILQHPVPILELEGLQKRIPNALSKILLENINKDDKTAFFLEFAKIEPFLKKIIYLIDEPSFSRINSNRSGLANCIDYLELNPTNLRLSQTTVSSVIGQPQYIEHIIRSYHLRNLEGHVCKSWTQKEMFENLESVLVVYLYTVHLHFGALYSVISPAPNFDTYLHKVVRDFEDWKDRFVHITGVESFDEIQINAIESEYWGESERTNLREGKIEELRRTIDESSMIILGEPGMGKSTTMQYLSYNDAKNILGGDMSQSLKVPIYVELKLLSINESILNECCHKLGVKEDVMIEYLNDGKISLFLDGLNEVHQELRAPIRKEIQRLMESYKNSFIIVTSRPLAYSNEFKQTPVFNLKRLSNEQVEEFLEKNCSESRCRQILRDEVNSNLRLGKIVRVPLLLKMLINVVVSKHGMIPENKTEIISYFIQNIYKRERQKLVDTIDLRIIHRLLCFLGYSTRDKNASNAGWRIEQFEAVIEDRIFKSNFDLNVYQFIDMATDLHLLVKDGEKYSFIHELYQEYFASEEMFRLNAIIDEG